MKYSDENNMPENRPATETNKVIVDASVLPDGNTLCGGEFELEAQIKKDSVTIRQIKGTLLQLEAYLDEDRYPAANQELAGY